MSSSSSDEAPEETSFNVSELKSKLRARDQKRQRDSVAHSARKIRQDLDMKLKQQKRPRLSEVLQDLPDSESEREDTGVAPAPKKLQPKKRVFEKELGGVRVKVVKARSQSVAPPKVSASSRKDRFLQRKSILRR